MAEETIISWNAPNWITITLMGTVGFALVALIGKLVKQQAGQ